MAAYGVIGGFSGRGVNLRRFFINRWVRELNFSRGGGLEQPKASGEAEQGDRAE